MVAMTSFSIAIVVSVKLKQTYSVVGLYLIVSNILGPETLVSELSLRQTQKALL